MTTSAPKPRKFLITLGLKDEQLLLIGNTTAHWSVIEWMLMRIIESLLPTGPKEARILAVGMGAVEKIKVARLLALQRLPEGDKRAILLFALNMVDQARADRNDIAHGIWTVDKDDGKLHLVGYRGGRNDINRIKGKPKPIETADLERIFWNVKTSLDLLLSWREKHRPEVEIHTEE